MNRQILIIGGGASGLTAAIAAARRGAKVTVLEKNRQTGKKIQVTGNGRCNLSNRDQKLKYYRTGCPGFVEKALQAFSMQDSIKFFEELGIFIKDRNGYLYPNSGQAASVEKALRLEALRLGSKIVCDTKALSVEKTDGIFHIFSEGWVYQAEALILACGSMAAPNTGSDGDGYRFAESLGHQIIKPLPALVGLCAAEKDCKKLAGVRIDGNVTLLVDGKEVSKDRGEIQFTSYGLSGIPIFQISRYAAKALSAGKTCSINLDFFPDIDRDKLIENLKKTMEYTKDRSGTDSLLGIFPEKLSQVLLEWSGLKKKKIKDWNDEEFVRMVTLWKQMHFTILRCRDFEQAQVCTGGVPLTELAGISMESLKTPGLYLCGELLDVDGACGGYNLQWAWTSGYLAGEGAAKGLEGT